MLKLVILFATIVSLYSISTTYENAPISLTLLNGYYTETVRGISKNQITCEDLSHCPLKIHCSRDPNIILQKDTKWNCDIFGKKYTKYNYIIRWEVSNIRWNASNIMGHFNKNSFYVQVQKKNVKKQNVKKQTFIDILLTVSLILLFSKFISCLNLDFISLILGIILTIKFNNNDNNGWHSDNNISLELY